MELRTRRRRSASIVRRALAVGAVVVAVAMPAPAHAHTDMVSSDPTSGARLQQAPARVGLTFTEPMDAALSQVGLTVDGEVLGGVSVAGGDTPAELVVSLPEGAEGGRWRLAFRVTSQDGHPVTGAIQFTVADPVASPLSPETSAPDSPSPAESSPAEKSTATPSGIPDTSEADSSTEAASDTERRDDGGQWSFVAPGAVLLLVALLAVAALRHLGRHEDDDADEHPEAL